MGRTPDSGGGAARPACRGATELTRFTQLWQGACEKVSRIRNSVRINATQQCVLHDGEKGGSLATLATLQFTAVVASANRLGRNNIDQWHRE
ncbi:hypothetical protein [Xanthomonas euvesicatoria]|nr:hypothetical protein [Xanthomonas euvesicatoria]